MGYAENKPPASIYGLLALRQHQLNQAVGIRRMTSQVELLLVNYERGKEQEATERLQQLGRKAYLLGIIRGAKKRIEEVGQMVTPDTPLDEAQELYRQALFLQEQIKQATEAMNG